MIIAIDQSTSATKAMLFDEQCRLIYRANVPHQQYYPKAGWVEHDAEEIYLNTVKAVSQLPLSEDRETYSVALTNQRETVVVWNRLTGRPIHRAVVWQCMRGADYCNRLKADGCADMVRERTGLLIDPYFSASGVKWILDHVEGARSAADRGELLMGTIDTWLVWKLTGGRIHATDRTNASRTLLMNIRTLDWDDEMLRLFTIPRSMMPDIMPCDAIFGDTTFDGVLQHPVCIAGVLGDSHGALTGQMCFTAGLGKATYGTGSSVMVNIGEQYAEAPEGLVTSVGFAAQGKTCYAFEGNIHCTGATLKWLEQQLQFIQSPDEVEAAARSVDRQRRRLSGAGFRRTGGAMVERPRTSRHPRHDARHDKGPRVARRSGVHRLSGERPGERHDPTRRHHAARTSRGRRPHKESIPHAISGRLPARARQLLRGGRSVGLGSRHHERTSTRHMVVARRSGATPPQQALTDARRQRSADGAMDSRMGGSRENTDQQRITL